MLGKEIDILEAWAEIRARRCDQGRSPTGIFYTQRPLRLSWPGVRVNEVDQSCFESFIGLRSGLLNRMPPRNGAQRGGQNHGDHCKYRHINQAAGIPAA